MNIGTPILYYELDGRSSADRMDYQSFHQIGGDWDWVLRWDFIISFCPTLFLYEPRGMGLNKKNMPSNSTTLEGVLERITFYNEENGFLIGKLKGNEGKVEIAVVGKAPKCNVEKP